jgi:HlyD family secretion protein
MRRILLSALGLGILVAALAAANLRRDPSAQTLDWQLIRRPPREVTTETLALGPIVQTVTAPGKVELKDEAKIASQIVGKVIYVKPGRDGGKLQDGDVVHKDELLVGLDPTAAKARRDSALARIERLKDAIRQATTDREKALRDLNRSNQLAGRGVVTQTELADNRTLLAKAEAALGMSHNDLAEAKAMLESSQQELDYTEIRAPMDGVVAGVDVEVGEVVIAGTTNLPGTVLMTLGDLKSQRVRADVDETDVPLVQPGQPARIFLQADPTRPLAGSVELVAPKGKKTEEVVSFETLVKIDEDDGTRLKPGMTATVEIEVKRSDSALGVPVQAVVHRRRKDLPDTPAVRSWAEKHARSPGEKATEAEARYIKIVFALEGGAARALPVETGLSDEHRVEILSGLKAADHVIVGPFRALDELKDGDAVSLAKPDAKASRP